MLKTVGDLSGGEAQRLALALLTSSDANLLILDEPTNHLDLESREALEDALTAFAGSVLLISHDRALLEAVGSRTVVIEDGSLRSPSRRLGGVPGRRATPSATPPAPRERKRSGPPRKAGPSKNRQAQLARLEREVTEAEAALRALEDELADPSHWGDPRSSAKATRRHEEAQRALRDAMARWEHAAEAAQD